MYLCPTETPRVASGTSEWNVLSPMVKQGDGADRRQHGVAVRRGWDRVYSLGGLGQGVGVGPVPTGPDPARGLVGATTNAPSHLWHGAFGLTAPAGGIRAPATAAPVMPRLLTGRGPRGWRAQHFRLGGYALEADGFRSLGEVERACWFGR